jgi:hypothetical protein
MGKLCIFAMAFLANEILMAANLPVSGVSAGSNLVSAMSVAIGESPIPISSVYRNSEESNSIDLDATRYQFFLMIFR